ncbi:membrane protein [Candidatus Magnetomorum sp. HK-1]|nr:membrane protein [Candidatus Magnetomorum sp. HK-1]
MNTIKNTYRSGIPTRFSVVMPWLIIFFSTTYLIVYFTRNSSELMILSRLELDLLLWLFFMQGIHLLVQGCRYYIVIKEFGARVIRLRAWLRLYLTARFVNILIPQLGNLYRAMYLKYSYGVSFSDYASGYTFFIWLSSIVTTLLAIPTIFIADQALSVFDVHVYSLLIVMLAALLLAPLTIWWLSTLRLLDNSFLSWSQKKISAGTKAAVVTIYSRRFWFFYLLSSSIAIYLGANIVMKGFAIFDIRITFAHAILIYVCLHFLCLVPITPGNLGVQELALGTLVTGLGFTIGEGVLVSALLRVLDLVSLSLLAIPVGALDALKAARQNNFQDRFDNLEGC